MAEEIHIESGLTKEEIYKSLLPQIEALVEGENDLVANLANVAAALKEALGFFWVGFYVVKDGQLVLGPFQGPVACTRIDLGKGVCGAAWEKNETIIVPDVEQFPGHIACNAAARSEIVVPISKEGKVRMVLDVDSDQLDDFDQTDQDALLRVAELICDRIN